jgi:glycosyltransferase involved in cell wall biosynthesis
MFFSCIIPVYNRPGELRELLSSLLAQSYSQFEVIVVEDGSSIRCKDVVDTFADQLTLHYFYQENTGQGFARNFGMQQAKGDFFVILDSDVLLPPTYFQALEKAIASRSLDAFGGPDAAAEDFSPLQKAMDFAMTSFWTTLNGACASRRLDSDWNWCLKLLSTTNEKIPCGPSRSRPFLLAEIELTCLAFTQRQSSWCTGCLPSFCFF